MIYNLLLMTSWIVGMQHRVHGIENQVTDGPRVIVVNHQSALDIPDREGGKRGGALAVAKVSIWGNTGFTRIKRTAFDTTSKHAHQTPLHPTSDNCLFGLLVDVVAENRLLLKGNKYSTCKIVSDEFLEVLRRNAVLKECFSQLLAFLHYELHQLTERAGVCTVDFCIWGNCVPKVDRHPSLNPCLELKHEICPANASECVQPARTAKQFPAPNATID
ncbi:hypothetical protein TcWFU_008169 [Taenia crassiceps]|uniref:Uncharacterized protein n=1 Tax=Taenia crassiceps TaxID=6207 RepID=A0ABR4QIH5_9CEST